MYSPLYHPRSLEHLEKFTITSLTYQWILSEWVLSECESKQLIKKMYNPQVINMTPVHN